MNKFILLLTIIFFISQNAFSQNTKKWLSAYENRYVLSDSIITYYNNEIKHTSNKDDLLLLYSLKSLAYRPLKKFALADTTLLQADSCFVKKQSLPVAIYLTAKARYYEYYDLSDKAAETYIEAYSIFQKLKKNRLDKRFSGLCGILFANRAIKIFQSCIPICTIHT